MAIERSVWRTRIDESFKNTYPCPRCDKGRIARGNNPVILVEPRYSEREHILDEWEPDWIVLSFTTVLICDNKACGEVVSVSGRGGVEEYYLYGPYGEPEGSEVNTWLQPVSMFPAPPLFPIAKNLPQEVKKELKLAFQLYWSDRSASTSRLRTSLERILDDQGIAANKPDKAGGLRRLTLFERIDIFEKEKNEVEIAESMNAMRIVGNLGTHGDEVTEGDYFDLIDVFEDAISEVYEHKTAKLKAKKKALLNLKK